MSSMNLDSPMPYESQWCLLLGLNRMSPLILSIYRVIYYDMADPFWGQKLVDKVSENILSALKNPEEAILPRALEQIQG